MSNLLKEKKPVILCHAACTGGSLIYRCLVEAFGFTGISEISNAYIPKRDAYLSLDPEAQLLSQGVVSSSQFEDIFFNRIVNCDRIVNSYGKKLLIREHSHRYFFNPHHDHSKFNTVSWINDAYCKYEKQPLLVLVSVRDPIDSWLGLRNSYPNECPKTFDEYCYNYLNFIKMVDKTSYVYLFKYENFVSHFDKTIKDIGDFIGQDSSIKQSDHISSAVSSGNSGRQGMKIILRPRRPYTTRLLNELNTSSNYNELCDITGYPNISFDKNLNYKVFFIKNNVIASFWSTIYSLAKAFSKLFQFVKVNQRRD